MQSVELELLELPRAEHRRVQERWRKFSVSVDVTSEFRKEVSELSEDAWKDVVHRLLLVDSWKNLRMKVLRFRLICQPGRVIEHARDTIVRLAPGCSAFDVFRRARERIRMLARAT